MLAELRSGASPAVLRLAERVAGGCDVRYLRDLCRALLDNRSTDTLDFTVRARRGALTVGLGGGVRDDVCAVPGWAADGVLVLASH